MRETPLTLHEQPILEALPLLTVSLPLVLLFPRFLCFSIPIVLTLRTPIVNCPHLSLLGGLY